MPFDDDAGGDDQRREDAMREAAAQGSTSLVDERDAAPLDASGKDPAVAKESKRKGRKMMLAFFLLILFLIIVAGVGFVAYRLLAGWRQQEPTVRVGTAEEKGAGGQTNLSNDEKLQAALGVLASREPKGGAGDAANAVPSAPAGGDGLGNTNSGAGAGGKGETEVPNGLKSETVGGGGGRGGDTLYAGDDVGGRDPARQAAAQPTPAQAGGTGGLRGGPSDVASAVTRGGSNSPARSVLHSPRKAAESQPSPSPVASGAEGDRATVSPAAGGELSLPTFGAMLPVRSLGAIYTLRSSGGVVRFEVPYEKRGKGYVIPKGTEIVGVVRGGDSDRAFITITGLIDPASGKFVKLAGDVLGSDGATGIRGEKKRLSGRWASFFGKLRDAGIASVGAAAGAIGRGPLIITDVYRRGAGSLSSEINGVLVDGRDGFVMVKAGTTGFVYVTQMPEEIHGLQELSSMSRDLIGALADSARRRAATGLSEDRLAEILTRGDLDEIRRAMGDMTPEMRRVAEAMLRDAGVR